MARSEIPWRVGARLALGLVGLGVGLGALLVAQGPGASTTYAGQSTATAGLATVAGLALVGAGLLLSVGRSSRRVGDLVMLAGFAWFAPVWVGWHGGVPVVRSVAMLAAGLTFPLLVHAALAYPHGNLRDVAARVLLGAAYVGTLLVTLGLALFRDPFFDPDCWANCTDNVFLVRSLPGLARSIEVADRWFQVALGAGFAAVAAARLLGSSPPARRALLPVLVPVAVLAGAVAARAIAHGWLPGEDPSEPTYLSIFVVASTAVILLAGGLVSGVVRLTLQRGAVARIVATLGAAPRPGALGLSLAQAVGDSQLRIAYPLSGGREFVDADGRPVAEPVRGRGRAVTALVRGQEPVALVSHAAGLPDIESVLGPAVRLALDNERLQAEGLARLEELRASRARIVETGDAERRRLERDLHDGAQQRLLAVLYEIRLARASAEAHGDTATGASLTTALEELQRALDELRDLAHGIYPAILEQAGLATALASLADTPALRVEIGHVTDERYPSPVETAAYVLVVEALGSAVSRGATRASVSAAREDDELVVAVDDDGTERIAPMVHLADRVGALGGSLQIGPNRIRAALPCV